MSIQVTVVATDACYPINYQTIGHLDGDILTVQYPFTDTEGVILPEEMCEDSGIDLSHIILPDGTEVPIAQYQGKIQSVMGKQFMASWGTSYVSPGSKTVAETFFTEALGYGDSERDQIAALEVGETCLLDAGDHAVSRIF